jgi:hypothetical protein
MWNWHIENIEKIPSAKPIHEWKGWYATVVIGQKQNGDPRKTIVIYGYFNLWAIGLFASKSKRFCNPQLLGAMARQRY